MPIRLSGTQGITFNDSTQQSSAGAQLLQTNGYQRLPSGLILQWCEGSASSSNGSEQTITFPIVFPNLLLQVLVSTQNNTAGTAEGYYQVKSKSNSSVVVRWTYSGNAPNSITPIIFAIGY